MPYRRELLSRLRQQSHEKGSTGDSDTKERCYHLFLDEVNNLVSERLLAHTDDNMLYILYSRWAHWCCSELSYEERQQMFLASFIVLPSLKQPESVLEKPSAENVLSIFGR